MKLALKNTASFSLTILIVFLVSVLVRLPHFLSQDFFFDGDEGLLGIMAQDFLKGKGLPLYFYGQNYGFSSLEVISTAFFIKLFGTGIWALRLGGLLIFSVGVAFVWKTFCEMKMSKLLSVTVVILLLVAPTWYLWAAMVRGGYVTAFMCFGILFYISQIKELSWKWIVIAAIISLITYESQPLLFIPILPFLANWMMPFKMNLIKIIGFGFIATLLFALFHYFGSTEDVWSAPRAAFFDFQQIKNLYNQSAGIIYGYSNFFFFTMDVTIPIWWFILLLVSLLIIFIMLIRFYSNSSSVHKRVLIWMVICLVLTVFLISAVSLYTPRYWLGFFTGILFLFLYSILHGSHKSKIVMTYGLAVIYCFGLFSVKDMRRDWYYVDVNEMDALTTLYDEVNARKIKAVFITDPVIQWKWNYLFGQSIPGTFFSYTERTDEFHDLAFVELNVHPENTAVIGLFGNYMGLDELEEFKRETEQIAIKYYIMDSVNKNTIYETVARVQSP